MDKLAFYDVDSKVLTAWGYIFDNCRMDHPACDPSVVVPWDFELMPGQWRLLDGTANPPTWEPYPPPGP
jgi:hypothetical protein